MMMRRILLWLVDTISEDVVFVFGVDQWSWYLGLGSFCNILVFQESVFIFIEIIVIAGVALTASTVFGGDSLVVLLLLTAGCGSSASVIAGSGGDSRFVRS